MVIGKFYPPHAGHQVLIDSAVDGCDELTVIVCSTLEELPSGVMRAGWVRQLYPGVRVVLVDDHFGRHDDSPYWAELTLGWTGFRPDVVFTSETYGDAWARSLGCRHISVDPERLRVPICGTAVRADPFGHWDHLAPCVRSWYARRVVVVGSESTGTTTLARALAEHYECPWVAEYGREYSAQTFDGPNGKGWSTDEFVHIAQEQLRREGAAAAGSRGLVICDTDAVATGIWHERYMGVRSPEVERVGTPSRAALYLVTDVDTPFVQDGLRDGERIREWMHARFLERLPETGVPFAVVSGSAGDRLRSAVALVDTMTALPARRLTAPSATGEQ